VHPSSVYLAHDQISNDDISVGSPQSVFPV
jgi:hypothetical protein